MELSDLTAYAEEKYHIEEEHKWPDFPGFSVLCSPDTGKWLALLMRQWDSISGDIVEVCDIKCGQTILEYPHSPYLSKPFRMHGKKWVGVRMGQYLDIHVVYALLDLAVETERKQRYTIELDPKPSGKVYSEKAAMPRPSQPSRIPKKIFDMIHLYDFSDTSFAGKCRNFYTQGKFMEDFEDDAAQSDIKFKHYYTTYHDLNITQLRAYFTWRANVRKGVYRPISLSLAYMYLYELLCGIGCSTPEEAFGKLQDFDRGFVDAGYGNARMRSNLHQWMFDFAVVHGLDPETARKYVHPEELAWYDVVSVLKEPQQHTDEEIVHVLSFVYEQVKGAWNTPVIKTYGERGVHLFALAWRAAFCDSKTDIVTKLFGERIELEYRPFSNAVYYSPEKHPDAVYGFSAGRQYICKHGRWRVRSYIMGLFDLDGIIGFVHESDLIFRKYFKTGHYLRKKQSEQWVQPYALKALEEEEKERQQALKPKITIHLSGLDKIRADAAVTRDSLLTEEELEEGIEEKQPEAKEELPEAKQDPADNKAILEMLLHGEDVSSYIKKHHLIPSVVTDEINEELFDEIGDNVLTCDGNKIEVIDDYRDDLLELIGEK